MVDVFGPDRQSAAMVAALIKKGSDLKAEGAMISPLVCGVLIARLPTNSKFVESATSLISKTKDKTLTKYALRALLLGAAPELFASKQFIVLIGGMHSSAGLHMHLDNHLGEVLSECEAAGASKYVTALTSCVHAVFPEAAAAFLARFASHVTADLAGKRPPAVVLSEVITGNCVTTAETRLADIVGVDGPAATADRLSALFGAFPQSERLVNVLLRSHLSKVCAISRGVAAGDEKCSMCMRQLLRVIGQFNSAIEAYSQAGVFRMMGVGSDGTATFVAMVAKESAWLKGKLPAALEQYMEHAYPGVSL